MILLVLMPVQTTTFSPKQQPLLDDIDKLELGTMSADCYLFPEADVEASNMENFLKIVLKRAR